MVRLDRPAEAAAFAADPDAALVGLAEPVMLDEWQLVPSILGAIKRAVDDDPRPGRFIVTGSVRGDLDAPTWPGTGRLVRLPMAPLSIREQVDRLARRSLVDTVIDGEPPTIAPNSPDLPGYIALALRGGFPEPALLLADDDARRRWAESYVDQLLTRDAAALEDRDPGKLRSFLEAFTLTSAGVVNDTTLFDAAAINRKTALAYERLLENLLVVRSLRPLAGRRLSRIALGAKRLLIDPSLFVGVLGLDTLAVMRDGDLIGRVLETFVVAQLQAEADRAHTRVRFFHLRQDRGRREIDVVLELPDGRIIGAEVKATAAPKSDDARHLAWLRDQLGVAFVAGIVFHTGPRAFSLGDRLSALPISTLWG